MRHVEQDKPNFASVSAVFSTRCSTLTSNFIISTLVAIRACCSGLEHIGVTGHGQCWLLAALALEDFAEAELKFKFDLGRAHALEEDVAHTRPECDTTTG
jgi:hypothetical protein